MTDHLETSHDDLELIRCACTNLRMSARVVSRLYDQTLAELKLNAAQYAILINIHRRSQVSSSNLARLLHLDLTTLYRAIAVLEKRNLLNRTRGGKGKTQLIALTEKGEALVKAATPKWQAAQDELASKVGREAFAGLIAALRQVQSIDPSNSKAQ